jgi:hypothetical protein
VPWSWLLGEQRRVWPPVPRIAARAICLVSGSDPEFRRREATRLGRRDRVNRRVVERHMAVSGVTTIDPEVRPGPLGFNRTQVELLRWIGSHYFRLEACRSRRWIFRPGASRCPILSTRHIPRPTSPAPLTSLIAGQRRPHHPARVAGLRVKSTQLTTMPHTTPTAGETKRE